MRSALFLALMMSALAFAGCLSNTDEGTNGVSAALDDGITTPEEREFLADDFVVTDGRSHTLETGQYGIDDARSVFVDVELPPQEGGNAVNPEAPAQVHLGLFLPIIEGCDWDAQELPAHCNVPVIADAGPYYGTPGDVLHDSIPFGFWGEGDVPADERGSTRLGEFLISRFVPHGYAVAQVSVFGTGQSTHCFDSFGLAEQLSVVESVNWLGSQPWSNGNVGLIGRSYDGSTPWMAAAHGPEALKTIVPISGLSGLGDLVFWNGAAEGRAYTFQNVVYSGYGFDGNEAPQDTAAQITCPDWDLAAAHGVAAYTSGMESNPAYGYWEERAYIDRAVEHYDGSVYMIHGLQDNNVDPHAGWRGELALREKGLDVRAMWGQWYHNYPDTIHEHGIAYDDETGELIELAHRNSIRMDWAQDLLEWFNFYLKETGDQPLLHAEIQELGGEWRIESVWPPADAAIIELPLGDGAPNIQPPAGLFGTNAVDGSTTINFGVLSEDEDTLLGGFSSVHLFVEASGPGGQLYVELRDGTENADFGLSYGIMDLRQATGSWEAVSPGQRIEVAIPFQNFDAKLPAGHELHLRIAHTGNDFEDNAIVAPVTVDLPVSTLHLSTLERGDDAYYQPPVWWTEDAEGHTTGQKKADEADEE